MYNKPRTAKRLYLGVIPRTVDDYVSGLHAYQKQGGVEKLNNPVWHIHGGSPPYQESAVSYALLLNLVAACHSEDPAFIWHYVSTYYGEDTARNEDLIRRLIGHAIAYYQDFVKPRQRHRLPQPEELAALADLAEALSAAPAPATAEALQTIVYDVGKRYAAVFPGLKDWFRALYQILLGQDEGPRMGSFIALYGVGDMVALLNDAVAKGGAQASAGSSGRPAADVAAGRCGEGY
jgi:lysyl-tRNA synthetase class 1